MVSVIMVSVESIIMYHRLWSECTKFDGYKNLVMQGWK